MSKQYRFHFFPLGLLGSFFNPNKLAEAIRQGSQGGFRLLRREFTLEPRRFLLFLKSLAFGLVFQRDENTPDGEYDWKVASYRTRLLTKTVRVKSFQDVINRQASQGYELYYAMKYPARFLFFFPREAYFFIFRKPLDRPATQSYTYTVQQTPYRLFSKTLDANVYTQQLNTFGDSANLITTFRDERRVMGLFAQATVLAIWENNTMAAASGYQNEHQMAFAGR